MGVIKECCHVYQIVNFAILDLSYPKLNPSAQMLLSLLSNVLF